MRSKQRRGPLVPGRAIAAAVSAILCLSGCARTAATGSARVEQGLRPSARPNVILVTVDAFRADHVGCLGYARPTTPRLDALARDGVLFEQAVANGGWTLPGIASLLTGFTPPVHRIQDSGFRLPPAIRTLASCLREAGYRAPALLPWYREAGRGFGFDPPEDDPDMALDYGGPAPEKYRRVLSWIRDHRDRPFFLHIHDPDPHLPYEPSRENLAIFEPEPYAGPPVEGSRATAAALAAGKLELDSAQKAHLVNLYDAGLREADSNLARFLDDLDRMGVLAESILVVTADHGEEILDHGQLGHAWWTYRGNLHDETVRIPLVLWGIGSAGGKPVRGIRIADPVQQADLTPTLLDLLGVPAPKGLDGMSLAAAIEAAAAGRPSPLPPDRPIFAESSPAGFYAVPEVMGQIWLRSVRLAPWKLIEEQGVLETRYALYDLSVDPGETRDLSADHPEVVGRLKKLIEEWIRESRRKSLELRAPALPPEAILEIENAIERP